MRNNIERVKYLESLLPKSFEELDKKYFENFSKYGSYMGNGVYSWKDLYAADTRELYLMGILKCEGIQYDEDNDEENDED